MSSASINTLGSGIIKSYLNYAKLSSVSTEDAFRAISLQVGGDGSKIDKETLDSFIANADEDTADLSQLKTLQKNWYKISSGDEEISAKNVTSNKEYSNLFFSALTSKISKDVSSFTTTSTSSETSSSTTDKIYSFLIDSAINCNSSSTSTKYDLLNSILNSLLSSDSTDDNSDAIDTVVNLIAAMQQSSMNTVSYNI